MNTRPIKAFLSWPTFSFPCVPPTGACWGQSLPSHSELQHICTVRFGKSNNFCRKSRAEWSGTLKMYWILFRERQFQLQRENWRQFGRWWTNVFLIFLLLLSDLIGFEKFREEKRRRKDESERHLVTEELHSVCEWTGRLYKTHWCYRSHHPGEEHFENFLIKCWKTILYYVQNQLSVSPSMKINRLLPDGVTNVHRRYEEATDEPVEED